MCERLRRGRDQPGQRRVPLWPPALDGLELGALGGPEPTHDSVREPQRCGRMTTPMLQEETLQRLRRAWRTLLPNKLAVSSLQIGSFAENAFAGRGLHRAIHITVRHARRPRSRRLHAGQREAPSWTRSQPKATFILAKDAHRARRRWSPHGLALGTFRLQQG